MKIKGTHYQVLKDAVLALGPGIDRHKEFIFEEAQKPDTKIKDAQTRFLWDVFWAARRTCEKLRGYSYQEWDYKDAHVETALRKILAERGGK